MFEARVFPSPTHFSWLLDPAVRQGAKAESPIPAGFHQQWFLHRFLQNPEEDSAVLAHASSLLRFEEGRRVVGGFRLPPLLEAIFTVRPDLQRLFNLQTLKGRKQALCWFYLHGVREYKLHGLLDTATVNLLNSAPPVLDMPGRPINDTQSLTWLMLFVWHGAAELQTLFDISRPDGRVAFHEWFFRHGVADLQLGPLLDSSGSVVAGPAAAVAGVQVRPFGVNLIGFAFGELGIGEDVRMAVAACGAAGIPFHVINIHPGDALRQADKSLARYIEAAGSAQEAAPYAINVFCMTAFDTARVYLERHDLFSADRYHIGWWPWELPVWPKHWKVVHQLVDEIWASSAFTAAIYKKSRKAVPMVSDHSVVLMPLPASVERVVPRTRRQLGLPAKTCIFLYVFDFNSYLARKNPFAAIRAFRKAFPVKDTGVSLVLKTMNVRPDNKEWHRFVQECGKDTRIRIIDRTLDRGEVLGLIQACDVYLSLHRSEGFGRTLAEAMLFGKPVVGTGFSGNTDFLKKATGFPVRWERRQVRSGEYPFVTEQDKAWWAEPDIADAARQLRAARAVARDVHFASRVRAFAEVQFSPARIGVLMRLQLEKRYKSFVMAGK